MHAPFRTDRPLSGPALTVAELPLAWRILHYANLYRLVVAGVCVASWLLYSAPLAATLQSPRLFFAIANLYLFVGLLFLLTVSARRPRLRLQVRVHFAVDLLCLVLLIHAGGGVAAGLGVLLVMPLAAESLLTERLQAMAMAAQASLALLLEQALTVWYNHALTGSLVSTGLLCALLFGVAGLANTLGRRVRAVERHVARQRADLARLSTISEMMIEDVPDGVLIIDADDTVRQINRRAQSMLRCGADVRGRPLLQVSPDIAGQLVRWRRRRAEGAPEPEEDAAATVRLHFIPVGSGATVSMVIFMVDTARSRQEAQQLKLAALGRLTANIAHEIRNPLAAISHAAELLEEEPAVGDSARLLRIVRDNSARLEKIVHDVLALNRYDRLRAEPLDMTAWLPAFADLFVQVEGLPLAGVVVEVSCDAAVVFDEQHLTQVLWNLCANAWRHGQRRPGSVRLRCRTEGGLPCLEVADDGPGVPAALAARLFEPFFTTERSGSGLGLYIARELCQANAARLELVPAPSGALFRISLEHAG